MSDSGRSTRPSASGAAVVPSTPWGSSAYSCLLQRADSSWQYLLAVLKAPVWPALLVYEAFQVLQGCAWLGEGREIYDCAVSIGGDQWSWRGAWPLWERCRARSSSIRKAP